MYNRTNADLAESLSLQVDNDMVRNDGKTNTVSETKPSNIDSNQNYNNHNPMRHCTSTKEPEEEPKKKTNST